MRGKSRISKTPGNLISQLPGQHNLVRNVQNGGYLKELYVMSYNKTGLGANRLIKIPGLCKQQLNDHTKTNDNLNP